MRGEMDTELIHEYRQRKTPQGGQFGQRRHTSRMQLFSLVREAGQFFVFCISDALIFTFGSQHGRPLADL